MSTSMSTSAAGAAGATATIALGVSNVVAGYGRQQVLYDVTVEVMAGEVVALLGHNGAGKSTLLRGVMGLVPTRHGRISVLGSDVTASSTAARVRAGLAYSPSEAGIFAQLTVRENLELGAYTSPRKASVARHLEHVLSVFPLLS